MPTHTPTSADSASTISPTVTKGPEGSEPCNFCGGTGYHEDLSYCRECFGRGWVIPPSAVLAKPADTDRVTAGSICRTAANLVSDDRAKTHGPKEVNHANIGRLWTAYLQNENILPPGITIDAHLAAMMLALLKVARTSAGAHNPDDYVDLAGYAGCAGEIAENLLKG